MDDTATLDVHPRRATAIGNQHPVHVKIATQAAQLAFWFDATHADTVRQNYR